MLNKYPLWKNLLILFTVVLSGIYAAPNFYPPDPAIQISHDSGVVDQVALNLAVSALEREGIGYSRSEIDNNGIALIRLLNQDDQAKAQQLVNFELPQDYIVALNLAANTPPWLMGMRAGPMTYGLDLQGGVHFLMEVDLEAAVAKQLNDSLAAIRTILRDERIRYRPPMVVDASNRIVIRFSDAESRNSANSRIRTEFPDYTIRSTQEGDDYVLYYTMSDLAMLQLQDYAIQQNLTTLRSRVNELGVKEPKIQQMGINRIVIELPGIQDTTRAKDLISAVATLQFHLVAEPGAAPGTYFESEYQGAMYRINEDVIVGGENVTGARTSINPETTLPQVNIELDAIGARRMNQATRINVGKSMAIQLSETKTRSITEIGPDGEMFTNAVPFSEERLISVATIQSALGRQFVITGLSGNEASDLALLIRSGALAAPMYFLEESTVGPSLGQENIDNGMKSVLFGLLAVMLFMTVYYKFCGILANIGLFTNLLMLMALMSIIGATLTMPGIAGIVLTLGMAVDANVLIFARIRDELKAGVSVPRAIDAGFGRALVTIIDANLTTLIVAIILYSIGTGPVKGFAVTLSIGIVTSVFTAVFITRALINLFYGGNDRRTISIGWGLPKPPRPAAA
jgi:preprotein translocase subunit SecD